MSAAGRTARPSYLGRSRRALDRGGLPGALLFGRAHLTIVALLVGFFVWVLWQLVPMLRGEFLDLVAGSIVRGGQ